MQQRTSLIGSFFIGSPLALIILCVSIQLGVPALAGMLVAAVAAVAVGRLVLRSI